MTGEVELHKPTPKKPWPGFPKMLSIVKVVAPIQYKRQLVKIIETSGNIEPILVDPRLGADQLKVEERRNTLEGFRNDLSAVLNQLDKRDFKKKEIIELPSSEDDVLSYIEKNMAAPLSEANALFEARQVLKQRLTDMEALESVVIKYQNLGLDPKLLVDANPKYTRIVVGTVVNTKVNSINFSAREISNDKYIFVSEPIDKEEAMFLLIYMNKDNEAIMEVLKDAQYTPVETPADSGLTLEDIRKEISSLKQQIDDNESNIKEFAAENGFLLAGLLEAIQIELTRISDIELKMKQTKTHVITWAWIPPKLQESFKSSVLTVTEGTAQVDFREGELDPSLVPSYTSNPPVFNAIRSLVSTFGAPASTEVDPYPFFLIFFFTFFGIMFADIGHGTLLFLTGVGISIKKRRMDSYPTDGIIGFIYGGSELFIFMGISAAFWGVLMGSVFGDETILWMTPLADIFGGRIENGEVVANSPFATWLFFYKLEVVTEHGKELIKIERNYLNLLIFSFVWGIITILTGIGIELYQKVYSRHNNAELLAPLLLLTIYVSAVLAFIFPLIALALIVVALGSIVFLFYIEYQHDGVGGMMLAIDHILSLLSNTFSFGRLLAMNTVHFVFAFLPYLFINMAVGTAEYSLQNHFAGTWGEVTAPLLPWWILSAAIGAAIILPVETTFSSLQALRLNWVEFFSKFFRGEGIMFRPVKVKRELTTDSY